MDEAEIVRTLRRWAAVDDEHREDLLRRCLAVLDQGECRGLSDDELEMLAAAGDVHERGSCDGISGRGDR